MEHGHDSARLTVKGPLVMQDARVGSSIAVNGVCLTVTGAAGSSSPTGANGAAGTFVADVMAETLARTGLADLAPGSRVNLERPVAASGRLGGHIVQGHVDGVGVVRERAASQHWELVRIGCPAHLARYLVEKGSVAVDGVSLTVVEVDDGLEPDAGPSFTVSLIPQTLADTTLGLRAVGDTVNLEVDVLAKYVERLLPAASAGTSSQRSRL